MAKAKQELSRRERDIMDALLELGDEGSGEEIRERMPSPPSYSAVRAMLVRMETKGIIRHKEKGLRYVYSPITPRSTARRSALQRLVRVFFGGSTGEAVTALLENEEWTADDLNEMSKRIERIKKEKGK
jgi:predicted transcriptional regulator